MSRGQRCWLHILVAPIQPDRIGETYIYTYVDCRVCLSGILEAAQFREHARCFGRQGEVDGTRRFKITPGTRYLAGESLAEDTTR